MTQPGTSGFRYNSPASVVSNKVEAGDQFVLIRQAKQGTEPEVWSSGDQQQTEQMLRHINKLQTTA